MHRVVFTSWQSGQVAACPWMSGLVRTVLGAQTVWTHRWAAQQAVCTVWPVLLPCSSGSSLAQTARKQPQSTVSAQVLIIISIIVLALKLDIKQKLPPCRINFKIFVNFYLFTKNAFLKTIMIVECIRCKLEVWPDLKE